MIKLLVLVSLLLTQAVWAQLSISGVVLNRQSLEAVADVNIYLREGQGGTVSDGEGYFKLEIPSGTPGTAIIILEHVSFDTLRLSLKEARGRSRFYLRPKVLESGRIVVEGRKNTDTALDLPVAINTMEAREFAGQGYIDVGDLLRTEQSIQIDESQSGRKTISMRGGNAGDVIIFYNGIRMSDNYDNGFDLALINVEDLQRVEVIKGSNTALYGAEAFSGVINLVPRVWQDHRLRFIQKFGSYNSGDWNLQLNHTFARRLHLSYGIRQAASRKAFTDGADALENNITQHTAHAVYLLDPDPEKSVHNSLSAMFIDTRLGYSNIRIFEGLNDRNRIYSLRYRGDIGATRDWLITASLQELRSEHNLLLLKSLLNRRIRSDSYRLDARKTLKGQNWEITGAYQAERSRVRFSDTRQDTSTYRLSTLNMDVLREKQGGVIIARLHSPVGNNLPGTIHLDASYRYDRVSDTPERAAPDSLTRVRYPAIDGEDIWRQGTYKVAFRLSMTRGAYDYDLFINTGLNVRFPTIARRLSQPVLLNDNPLSGSNRDPEKNRGTELGFRMERREADGSLIDRWKMRVSYFSNLYENKIRNFRVGFSSRALYDNIPTAAIKGLELSATLWMFRQHLRLEGTLADYDIPEKAAFPLKSDFKLTAGAVFHWRDFNFRVRWFSANEQTGWFREEDGSFSELRLKPFRNVNVHLSQSLSLWDIRSRVILSGQNLINDNTELNGLAIRDRRFYMALELKY